MFSEGMRFENTSERTWSNADTGSVWAIGPITPVPPVFPPRNPPPREPPKPPPKPKPKPKPGEGGKTA